MQANVDARGFVNANPDRVGRRASPRRPAAQPFKRNRLALGTAGQYLESR
jgi:hypothetical protein